MLDIDIDSLRQGFWRHFPLAAVVGVVIALEMAAVLMGGFRVSEEPARMAVMEASGVEVSNTKALGKLLYTEYIYPLEVAAAILLVAMIAAIALTLRQRKDSKFVSPSDQVRARSKDRMKVVKMAATQSARADGAAPADGQENAIAEKKS
jgi:NADH-quinone oxidoreductase subunit J